MDVNSGGCFRKDRIRRIWWHTAIVWRMNDAVVINKAGQVITAYTSQCYDDNYETSD